MAVRKSCDAHKHATTITTMQSALFKSTINECYTSRKLISIGESFKKKYNDASRHLGIFVCAICCKPWHRDQHDRRKDRQLGEGNHLPHTMMQLGGYLMSTVKTHQKSVVVYFLQGYLQRRPRIARCSTRIDTRNEDSLGVSLHLFPFSSRSLFLLYLTFSKMSCLYNRTR